MFNVCKYFRPCLVGVIIGRMENGGGKSGEKMVSMVVWLRGKRGWILVGFKSFLLEPTKTQSHQIGEKMREKRGQKYLDKNTLVTSFFFVRAFVFSIFYPKHKRHKRQHKVLPFLSIFFATPL